MRVFVSRGRAVLFGVVLLCACIAPLGGASPAAAGIAGQAALVGAANALLDSGLADLAGVSVDVPAGRVDVYRKDVTGLLPALALPGLAVHPARYSRAELTAAVRRVEGDAATLAARGVRVTSIGPRYDGGGLDVTAVATHGVSAGASRAVLRTRYGALLSSVHSVPASRPAPYFAGSRFNDHAPWRGGDRLAEGCTSGFPAADAGGTLRMLTAAHCGGPGTVFHNGPDASGAYRTMGTVTSSDDSTDIAVIGVSAATDSIEVGPATGTASRPVVAWEHPVVGQLLCQSGSYTGETCNLKVVDTGQYACVEWVISCTLYVGPVADVINSAGPGRYAAGHGDSGAPVYWYDSAGSVHGVGQVHGQLFPAAQSRYPGYFPDTMSCPAPEGTSARCSAGFSFAHLPGE